MNEEEFQKFKEESEKGYKAQLVKEFLNDFLIRKRAFVLGTLESLSFKELQDFAAAYSLYLQALREFENEIVYFIETGKIAEKELENNGR